MRLLKESPYLNPTIECPFCTHEEDIDLMVGFEKLETGVEIVECGNCRRQFYLVLTPVLKLTTLKKIDSE